MTDPKTLARTNNPQTSKDAAKRMVDSGKLSRQEDIVFSAILLWGKFYGNFTTKDIANSMCGSILYSRDKCYDICRKRFSGLFNKFKICLTGDRREGCRVWRLL